VIALIAGSTGLVGNLLLSELQQHYSEIICLVRKPGNSEIKGVSELVVDFDDLESIPIEVKADHLYLCLGTTIKKAGSKEAFRKVDYEYPYVISKLFKSRGTTHLFIVSALGADKGSSVFYNRVKGELENALMNLNFQGLSIFRPSLIMGERQETRFGEKIGQIIMRFFGLLFVGPLKKYKGVSANAIAKSMVQKRDVSGIRIVESDEIQDFEL